MQLLMGRLYTRVCYCHSVYLSPPPAALSLASGSEEPNAVMEKQLANGQNPN